MRLPSELNDLTLDHLHDDKPALAQCALVCRDWVNSARHHIWHTIDLDLTPTNVDDKLVRPLAIPDIAFHVRSIVLTSDSPIGKARTETDIHLLHRVLALLPNYPQLQSFTLRNITFSPNLCCGRCTALSVHSIHRLALLDVAFDALQDVQWLWCVFPSADNFQLDRVWWRPSGWPSGRPDLIFTNVVPRSAYKELALGHCCSRDTVAKWLLEVSSPLEVQTLRLPLVGIHDDFLVDLLRGIGVSLQHLEIGSLGHVKNSTQYHSFLDFSANTELKSISIGVPMYRDPATVLQWMSTILFQIVSTSVTRITFSLFPVHKSQNARAVLSAFDWPTLVLVLERPQFARLNDVVFRLAGQVDYLQYPHNFEPLRSILPEVVMGPFDRLRCKGVKVSIA